MKSSWIVLAPVALARIALALALAGSALAGGSQAADAQATARSTPLVTVGGQGMVSLAPDRATISFEIVTNNAAAAAATSQNNTIYAALRTRLGGLGVAADAIRTTQFSMTFVPKPPADAGANAYRPPQTGYIVTRSLSVTLDNLDAVGRTIDAAVSAGVTQLGGVSFGLRDQRGAYASALAAAMKDAEAQASALAGAAHLHLGPVRTISAGGYNPPVPTPVFRTMAAAAPSVPTDLPPSDVDVRANVTVTYQLVP